MPFISNVVTYEELRTALTNAVKIWKFAFRSTIAIIHASAFHTLMMAFIINISFKIVRKKSSSCCGRLVFHCTRLIFQDLHVEK